jgi:hypothetical protein
MFSRKWEVRRLMSVVVENRDVERKRLSDYSTTTEKGGPCIDMITGYTRAKGHPQDCKSRPRYMSTLRAHGGRAAIAR